MGEVYEVEREIESIRLPEWGRVVATDEDVARFVVVDPDGRPVEPIGRFLRDFVARGRALGSVRSYAFDLHRWWRPCRGWGFVGSGDVGGGAGLRFVASPGR
jgi:hypothetical protein